MEEEEENDVDDNEDEEPPRLTDTEDSDLDTNDEQEARDRDVDTSRPHISQRLWRHPPTPSPASSRESSIDRGRRWRDTDDEAEWLADYYADFEESLRTDMLREQNEAAERRRREQERRESTESTSNTESGGVINILSNGDSRGEREEGDGHGGADHVALRADRNRVGEAGEHLHEVREPLADEERNSHDPLLSEFRAILDFPTLLTESATRQLTEETTEMRPSPTTRRPPEQVEDAADLVRRMASPSWPSASPTTSRSSSRLSGSRFRDDELNDPFVVVQVRSRFGRTARSVYLPTGDQFLEAFNIQFGYWRCDEEWLDRVRSGGAWDPRGRAWAGVSLARSETFDAAEEEEENWPHLLEIMGAYRTILRYYEMVNDAPQSIGAQLAEETITAWSVAGRAGRFGISADNETLIRIYVYLMTSPSSHRQVIPVYEPFMSATATAREVGIYRLPLRDRRGENGESSNSLREDLRRLFGDVVSN